VPSDIAAHGHGARAGSVAEMKRIVLLIAVLGLAAFAAKKVKG
jgi:hypothetical protein